MQSANSKVQNAKCKTQKDSSLIICWMALFVALAGAWMPSLALAETVTLSMIQNEQTHDLVKPIILEAYRRIGYAVIFNELPAQRALEWANDGITDGDVARIAGTEKKYPNLIRISPPVIHFKASTFAVREPRKISNWSDLNGLSIGVVRGIRYSEVGTQGMNRILANDMTHLFTLLRLGRIDVAVATLDAGRIEIHRNFKGAGIHLVGEPLCEAPLFHYIHGKNGHLLQKLETVLGDMEQRGEIKAIRQRALTEMLGP